MAKDMTPDDMTDDELYAAVAARDRAKIDALRASAKPLLEDAEALTLRDPESVTALRNIKAQLANVVYPDGVKPRTG